MKITSLLLYLGWDFISGIYATQNGTSKISSFEMPEEIEPKGSDMVNVIVKYKNKEGISMASALSEKVTVHIERFKLMGIQISKEKMVELKNNSNVEKIEIDHMMYAIEDKKRVEDDLNTILACSTPSSSSECTPYGIEQTLQNDLAFFQSLPTPTQDIKVCVADTGYAYGHEDLPTTYVDGLNSPSNGLWNTDGHGHGTHVAGTVAAVGGNNKGVVGVIPDHMGGRFQLLIAKALSDSGSASSTSVLAAVDACVKTQKAKVVSMSLGGSSFSSSLRDSYQKLYDDEDVLLIAAAGNRGDSSYSYPASYAALMSVAANNVNENMASFSQFNDQVEISAPGVGTWSTLPNNRYASYQGTSMATPHVAAVAGILRAHFPNCKNYQIRNVLIKTAKDIAPSGCDVKSGFGLVQAKAAYDLLAEGNCGGNALTIPVGGCSQYGCTANSECNDNNECTTDTCNLGNGQCSYTQMACTQCGKFDVVVNLVTDQWGSETSWKIVDAASTELILSGSGYASSTSYSISKCIASGDYIFTISDSFGDGMCCTYGQGSYSLVVKGVEVATGGSFLSSESIPFSTQSATSSSPSDSPSSSPSEVPSNSPIGLLPTSSSKPSSFMQPTSVPSFVPSNLPSEIPSVNPSESPTIEVTVRPSFDKSLAPSPAFLNPISFPSQSPSESPSQNPSESPSQSPSESPSESPSQSPSKSPSESPSQNPSQSPSQNPSKSPSQSPSQNPSTSPTESPSFSPSDEPSDTPSLTPSNNPSQMPTLSSIPSMSPSFNPSLSPSELPSNFPSKTPSNFPSMSPSQQPSDIPSTNPFQSPSDLPSVKPSQQPSVSPSFHPSDSPSGSPSNLPSDVPSKSPSSKPSVQPSSKPSFHPSDKPSSIPSLQPSDNPSSKPSNLPSDSPSTSPSYVPSMMPSFMPSNSPSLQPSDYPSKSPTISDPPSLVPSEFPSNVPSKSPTTTPSYTPSNNPSDTPSNIPSNNPSDTPSSSPTQRPTSAPTRSPFFQIVTDIPTSPPLISCNDFSVTVEIVTDNNPRQTTWTITNFVGNIVASGGPYFSSNTLNSHTVCLDTDGAQLQSLGKGENTYYFTIYDKNGICCRRGSGSYTLMLNGALISTGGKFKRSETTIFNTIPTAPPTFITPEPTPKPRGSKCQPKKSRRCKKWKKCKPKSRKRCKKLLIP